MKLVSVFLYTMLDHILNSEITDKVVSITGGVTASVFTFLNTGFSGFILKCAAAAIFAVLGGLFGYLGKKLGEYLFNKYKSKKS